MTKEETVFNLCLFNNEYLQYECTMDQEL